MQLVSYLVTYRLDARWGVCVSASTMFDLGMTKLYMRRSSKLNMLPG